MSLPQTAPKINHTEITSGPWRVVPFNIGCNTIYDICYEGVRPIGTIAKKANANLVAAAPDLLHELKMTHAALMISKIGHYADSPQCERTKAAIAKATQGGEPQ